MSDHAVGDVLGVSIGYGETVAEAVIDWIGSTRALVATPDDRLSPRLVALKRRAISTWGTMVMIP